MHLPFVIISSKLSVIYSDVEKQTAMARKYINIYVLFKNNNKIFNFIKYVFYSSCKNHTLKDPHTSRRTFQLSYTLTHVFFSRSYSQYHLSINQQPEALEKPCSIFYVSYF